MRRSPRNLNFACNHAGLTHFGGVYFLQQFIRVLQLRDFLARHLAYRRVNSDYSVSQMLLALTYPIILGLDRIETASLLRSNGTFQYLTGLQSFPDPQTLRRFLLNAPAHLREQLHRANDRLLQRFVHLPEHRSRLIFDLDSTVLTLFGHQQGAEVGYNPRYRGKRSYDPLLCWEANSSFLWDVELRRGDAGTWSGSEELLACCFQSTPSDIRELRVRADAGFGYGPVLDMLEARAAQYAVVARMIPSLKRELRGLHYERMHASWEIAEFEHRPHAWSQARRCIVARRRIGETDPQPTLFTLERYAYRAWHTNIALTPEGVWHFYDGRAGMERRIREILGGLCTGEDSHARVCSQCPVSGSNSARLQPGHRFSANLSSRRMAKLDLEQAPAQTFLAARRTYPPPEPTYAAGSQFASDRTVVRQDTASSPQAKTT
jgi:hypothetical protein